MGLNVCVYSRLVKASAQVPDDYDFATQMFIHPLSVVEVDQFFPGRREGVEAGVVYDVGDRHEFDFSYSGYNKWRDQLARLAADVQPQAFRELIEFSDCEGVIGPVVSKKLSVDFSKFDEQARLVGGSFYKSFQQWKKAVEMASDNGAIVFQ